MQARTSYDTSLKHLYRLCLESAIPHFTESDIMKVQREMKEARLSRCEANKCNSCEDCPFIKDKVPLII